MITNSDLLKYRKSAETTLAKLTELEFNHYGIQAKDTDSYTREIEAMGGANSEVTYSNRRISTVISQLGILEILEPKPGQEVAKTAVDHVAYICPDLDVFRKSYTGEVISSFDVGSTHGIKITPAEGIIVELRNNNILDSISDFS